jgi:hypothetical protein
VTEYVCPQCGITFKRSGRSWAKKVYCSRECVAAAQRIYPKECTCAYCGKDFTRKHNPKRPDAPTYCSHACANRANADVDRNNLPVSRLRVLWRLGPTWKSCADLAEYTKCRYERVAVLLRELEREGLAERGIDPWDGQVWRRTMGRVCAQPGCGTRLSSFNPDPFCALHAQPEALSHRQWMMVYGEAC